MADYRPIPDYPSPEFRRIAQYAFDAHSGPHDPEEELDERQRRLFDFGERRGMFDGEDLRVVCKHLQFTARVRGTWLPLAGLGAVASPPEHRRRGLVGEMLAESLAEYRDRGWLLSALYPFDERFYGRYGWATGCRHQRATVDVGALAFAQDHAAGRFRRVHPDEADQLEPAFDAWLADRPLATDRTADWWHDVVLQQPDSELYGYAWERDGEPRGYVVYDVHHDEERSLRAHEFAFADHEAYLNLLRFCHDHDSQVDRVVIGGPDHSRLLELVDDREAVELEVVSSAMVRLVDVAAALETVEYPEELAASVTLAVADDHAPWNEDTIAVTVADGSATVEPVAELPDATVDVGTLSQLFVGHLSVADARRVAGLQVDDEEAAATLAAMFPERDPYLPEGF